MIDLQKNIYVYDIETDGLLKNATRLHCLSIAWRDKAGNVRVTSTTDPEAVKKFFTNPNITRVGHNIILYDERVIQKLLGIDTNASKNQIIDTLGLSWYLYPEKVKHGLEEWGIEFGTRKVEIKDWQNLSEEEYMRRCEQDTRINLKLWEKQLQDLYNLYNNNEQEIIRLINYLQFKLDCFREQEEERIRLDIPHIEKTLKRITRERDEKNAALESAMPHVPVKKIKTYKNVIKLKSGEFFQKGDLMYDHYFREGYRPIMEHSEEVIKAYKAPNANSVDQRKDWLYSLGWVPEHYKQVKDKKTGNIRKVPQIGSKLNDGSICDSIKKLFDKEPKLELLEGLSVLNHRIGLLEGLLKEQEDGYIEASMAGFTNTLRIKHSKIVNLPGVDKPLGKDIRGSLIAEEDGILCGSDMSSLEDTTKQHYIFNYDPQYVTEMRTPGFDPHLDIAVLAGMLTKEQAEAHKNKTEDHGTTRKKAKVVNFSATYGAGAPKIAATGGFPLKLAKVLHNTYWQRNKAVKQTAEACIVKTIGSKKWLYNPVSRFWYSLRAEKDRFSTLNQGTGVYCFDMYVKEVRKKNIRVSLQMHDEILFKTTEEDKEKVKEVLNEAIKSVNQTVKLNVPLGISIDFGKNYAAVH